MSPQEQAKTIFLEAIEKRDREDWSAFLDEKCGDNPNLRQQVERLLQTHVEMGTYQDGPELQLDATGDFQSAVLRPGASVGTYKLLQQIGEGGFGVVYMAEQLQPFRRQVALKIIKPGMDTKEVIARFEAERQALALMDHPNIAKVLDAGATPDKRPYFVMELVKGVPVTEFCDKNNFNSRLRLELFSTICNAVQHAHQKGVIHRDIKPSNVMVTLHDGQPVVKVIDFGVSKAISQRLTEKTLFTRYGQLVGTPQYMSPEQAEMSGLDVDTRSDIYSLGVLLYELLTGTTPLEAGHLRSAGYAEMVRLIQEEEPPKPSTRLSSLNEQLSVVCKQRSTDEKRLRQLVQGDLDWIVMKSLEKDRSRRYETASALATDIQRHLGDEPVAAGPPSAIYRFRKFARRNKGPVIAGLLVAAALIGGLAASTTGFVKANLERENALDAKAAAQRASEEAEEQENRAQREREQAIAQQQRAQSVLALMKQMLGSAGLTTENPRDFTVREMLDDFSETLEGQFQENPEIGVDIWTAIGDVYISIEEHEKTVEARQRAMKMARAAYRDQPTKLARLLCYASFSLLDLGSPSRWPLNAREAEKFAKESVEIYSSLTSDNSLVLAEMSGLRDEADAFVCLAWAQVLQYRIPDALHTYQQALVREMQLDPPERFAASGIAFCYRWMAEPEKALVQINSCLPTLRNALHYGEEGEELRIRFVHLIWSLAVKASLLWDLERFDEARETIEESLRYAENGKEHALAIYVGQRSMQAWIALAQGDSEFALSSLEELILLCQRANKLETEVPVWRAMAGMFFAAGHLESAHHKLEFCVEKCENRYGLSHEMTIEAQLNLAQHFEFVGDRAGADEILASLVREVERLVERSDNNPECLVKLAFVKSHLSTSDKQDLESSVELAREALSKVGRHYWPLARLSLAKAQIRLGRIAEAINTLRQGLVDRWTSPGWQVPVYEGFTTERELIRLVRIHATTAEIEEVLRQAIDDRAKYLTDAHPAPLEAKVRLVDWLVEQKRLEEAGALLDDIEQLAANPEAGIPYRRFAIETAIKLYQVLDQPNEVRSWKAKLKALDNGEPFRPWTARRDSGN